MSNESRNLRRRGFRPALDRYEARALSNLPSLRPAAFSLDAFSDPKEELGLVADGFAGGDSFGRLNLIELKADGDSGLSLGVALAEFGDLLGGQLERTDRFQFVAESAEVMGSSLVVGEGGHAFGELKIRAWLESFTRS